MLRTEGYNPKTKTINIIFMNGGVGDHIASLTAVNYITKQYPWITILLWTPDFLVDFSKNVLSETVQVKGFSQMKRSYEPTKPTKTTQWDGHTSPMKIHLIDYAFLKLCDENPSIEHKNYLQVDLTKIQVNHALPDKYIVITTGYTAKVREFPAFSINEIVKYAKGKGYETVFLGQTQTKTGTSHTIKGNFDENIDFSAGANLIDQTTLLEAAGIMSDSKAVLGVDNGLLHVAGCTHVPIIAGFTTVSPQMRLPIRNNELGWNCYPIVPGIELNCSFCQEKTNFLFGHDYKNCMYKDNLCTSLMTADKFIKHLEDIL